MKINTILDKNGYITSYATTQSAFVDGVDIEVPKEYVEIVEESGVFYGNDGTVINMNIPVEKLNSEFIRKYDCFKYVGGKLTLDKEKANKKEQEMIEKETNGIKLKIVELTKTKEIYEQNKWDTTELDDQIDKLKSKL